MKIPQSNSSEAYRLKLERDLRTQTGEINRQQNDFKKMMAEDNEKNKRLMDEKNRINNDQLAFQQKYHQKMMNQRDTDFKNRYEKTVKEHNEILARLTESFNADLRTIAEKTSSDKKRIEDQINDPFYQVTKLTPKLTEGPKDITVSIPVADHEKERVQLSATGRNIKLTLSRKFNDSVSAEDGSINKSTRSELYSKEFTTSDILSSKNISQKYEDGILSFKIQKA